MRLIDPSAGQIRLHDDDMAQYRGEPLRQIRQKIQIVFQDPYRSLNPRQRVGESIIEGLLNFGMARETAWRRAADLMRTVGLNEEVMTRYPHQFSGASGNASVLRGRWRWNLTCWWPMKPCRHSMSRCRRKC